MKALVGKIFTFDAAHQLVGHKGKCANLHGHTYKLEVRLYGDVISREQSESDEGFVIDFSDLKEVVKKKVVDPMDHAFLAEGIEPALESLHLSGSKVCYLGFRSTCENMAAFICHRLKQYYPKLIHSVVLWETPTSYAEVFARDIPETGPNYSSSGGCDV